MLIGLLGVAAISGYLFVEVMIIPRCIWNVAIARLCLSNSVLMTAFFSATATALILAVTLVKNYFD